MQDGVIARLARGISYVVTGQAPPAWFGPQTPLPPAAPAETAGRQFDYPFGFNMASTPRGFEPTGFAELRGLADNFDLLRGVIETRKDQVARLNWSIRPRNGASSGNDPRIAAIAAFFARPDRLHPWNAWLRMILEDLLVIDAPALYMRRTRGGSLYALEPLDGATIKRLIDDGGRTPAPPAPAYQQILKGVAAVDYAADELIYAPRNLRTHKAYGFSPVEQVQMSVNIALRRQIWQLQYYTEGNIPEALIGVPDTWNPDQIREFQSYWDSIHTGDLAARRHAKFVPGGVARTFIPTREPAMKDAFDEWLARVVCYAFSIPPTAFVSQTNRATAETAQDAGLNEGLVPLQAWVKDLVDGVIEAEFIAPDLEFAWSPDRAVDPAQAASIATSYVAAGIKSVNEVRAELGLRPVPGGDAPQAAKPGPALGKYSADQPRDDRGRWTDEDGGGATADTEPTSAKPTGAKPVQVASNDTGVRSDAMPEQVAQEEERDKEEESPDPVAPVRQAMWNSGIATLRQLDPHNPMLTYVTDPNAGTSQAALDRLNAEINDAATARVTDKVMPRGKPIGQEGSGPDVREVRGGLEAAQNLFDYLRVGGTVIKSDNPDATVVKLAGNAGHVTFRAISNSGPPAVNIDVPSIPFDTIHFP